MNVQLFNRQHVFSIDEKEIERLIKGFLTWKKVECEEVIVHFVDVEEISKLHGEYFDDPSSTDCISFPIDSPEEPECLVLGEIFVCPEVGIAYAKEHGIDPYHEIMRYIIHGLLHLLGFDDQDEKSQKIMRDEENSAMHYLINIS